MVKVKDEILRILADAIVSVSGLDGKLKKANRDIKRLRKEKAALKKKIETKDERIEYHEKMSDAAVRLARKYYDDNRLLLDLVKKKNKK